MLCKGLLQGLVARVTACHWLQNVTTLSCYMGDSYPYPYACTRTRIHIRITCTHIRIRTHGFLYPWENPCLTDTRIRISHGFTPGYNVCIRGLPLPLPICIAPQTQFQAPMVSVVSITQGHFQSPWNSAHLGMYAPCGMLFDTRSFYGPMVLQF
jgi:hypothetical protein